MHNAMSDGGDRALAELRLDCDDDLLCAGGVVEAFRLELLLVQRCATRVLESMRGATPMASTEPRNIKGIPASPLYTANLMLDDPALSTPRTVAFTGGFISRPP